MHQHRQGNALEISCIARESTGTGVEHSVNAHVNKPDDKPSNSSAPAPLPQLLSDPRAGETFDEQQRARVYLYTYPPGEENGAPLTPQERAEAAVLRVCQAIFGEVSVACQSAPFLVSLAPAVVRDSQASFPLVLLDSARRANGLVLRQFMSD